MNRLILFFAILCTPLRAQTDTVFPWLSHNDTFQSDLVINNLAATHANITLTAVRADGQQSTIALALDPLQQWKMDAGSAFPELGKGSGYAVFVNGDTDKVSGAFVVYGALESGRRAPAQANTALSTQAANILLFNFLSSGEENISAPVIVNTGDTAAEVTLKVFQNGALFGQTQVTIEAGRPYARVVSDMFPGLTGGSYLTAESTQSMLGVAFIFNTSLEPSMANAVPIDAVPDPDNIPNPNAGLVESLRLSNVLRIEHLVTDSAGTIYAAEGFNRFKLYKIQADGNVETLADGLNGPNAVAIDPDGNLYVTEFRTATLSKVTPDGQVSLLANVDGGPNGVTIDSKGNLYVTHFGAQGGDGTTVLKVTQAGETSLLTNSLPAPTGITVDPQDNVYIASEREPVILKISPAGVESRFANLPTQTGGHLAWHNGNLYMPGLLEHQVYKIDDQGDVTVYAGNGRQFVTDGPRLEANFNTPWGIAVHRDQLFVTSFGLAQTSIRIINID